MKTKIKIGEFKGKEMFQIWEVDKDGKEKAERPIINMGIKKAKYLLDNIEDLEEFVLRNTKE